MTNSMISILVFALLLSPISRFSLAKERFQKVSQQETELQYSRLDWNTQGGGRLHFQVVPVDRELFKMIQVSAGSGRTQKNINLTRQTDAALFEFVRNIFLGKYEIKSKPVGGLTGTWTTIQLTSKNGVSQSISNPTFSKDELDQLFQQLYQYVRDHIQGDLHE